MSVPLRFRSILASIVVALILVVANQGGTLAQANVSPIRGVELSGMDLSVPPGDDFYRYANGSWLAQTQIPDGMSSYGTFEQLQLQVLGQQLDLIESMAQNAPYGSDEWKAGQFWLQGIDTQTRDQLGAAPILPQIQMIDTATDLASLHRLFASPQFAGIPDLFNISVTPDPDDSSQAIYYLAGPYLGLPDVTWYGGDTQDHLNAQQAYRDTAAQLFQLIGYTPQQAQLAAANAYAFEATLAAIMLSPIDAQDYSVIDNPTPLAILQRIYPLLDWQEYIRAAGGQADGATIVIDSEVELMHNLQSIVTGTPVETIRDYLKLQLLIIASDYLSSDFEQAMTGYYGALYGVESTGDPVINALHAVNSFLPDAVGRAYAGAYFSPEARADVEQLVANLKEAFELRLEHNTWMSSATKLKAIEKLHAMTVKVGYPDQWESYAAFSLSDSYWETAFNAMAMQVHMTMASAGQPIDPDQWSMSPQTVNAAYNPTMNDITFPAAILQPPFFDPGADLASNYGAIGYVIGHEITHAFDLQGAQFDLHGNYADWWTPADEAAFLDHNNQVVQLYGEFEVLPGMFIDGQLTVTENVADLGGMQAAYDALQIALHHEGDPGPIDGLTQNQRFFIAAAQVWREKQLDSAIRTQILTDEHSPGIARAVLPALNMDAFYDAFPEVQPGDPEYIAPEDRIVIW
ncbi:MAG: M13 family metallopeptidase [Thermomicrobiales bacterium]|nr:M13 family metallopeptidase [Thermomicrobiales bacterium]